ncbi:MAG: helix-turn-helix domain-containing protein [Nitrospirota bacterium]|nr:helix-turn-helix domain-containing protein [Nitrospirota bacterium]
MAKESTSVRMQAQIQRMAEQGYSVRAIARALKVSRKTVRKILGITPNEESEVAGWIQAVDWDSVPKSSSSMIWDLETTPTKKPPPWWTSSKNATRKVR